MLPYLLLCFLKLHLSVTLPLQVDPAYTGRVGASEAALFLKKSGLSDIILGKVCQDRVFLQLSLGLPQQVEGCAPFYWGQASWEWLGHCHPL